MMVCRAVYVAQVLLAVSLWLPCRGQDSAKAAAYKPQLILQSGHNSAVHLIDASRDGKLIATAAYDGQIILWDARSGAALQRFHSVAEPTSIALNGDASLLAENDMRGKITVWDLRSGTRLRQLAATTIGFSVILFAPDEISIVFCDGQGKLSVVNSLTDDPSRIIAADGEGLSALAFSPDGKILAANGAGSKILLWDFASGTQTAVLQGTKYQASSLAFSKDGSRLVSGGGEFLKEGELALWDLAERRLIKTVSLSDKDTPTAVAFYSDREILVEKQIGGTELRGAATLLPTRLAPVTWLTSASFKSVADAHLLAMGGAGGTAWIADPATLEPVLAFPPHDEVNKGGLGTSFIRRGGSATAIRPLFSQSQEFLATIFDNGAGLWDLRTGAEIKSLLDLPVASATFAHGDRELVLGDYKGGLTRWILSNSSAPKVSRPFGEMPIWSVSWDEDLQQVAASSSNGMVKLIRLNDGSVVRTWDTQTKGESAVAIQVGGRRIAFESQDGNLWFWLTANGKLLGTRKQTQCGFNQPELAWTRDGSLLAATCGSDVAIWDSATLSLLKLLHGHSDKVTSVDFSGADERTLVTTAQDGNTIIWDLRTYEMRHIYPTGAALNGASTVSHDGRWLAATDSDAAVSIWNVQDYSPVCKLIAVDGTADWLVVSPRGWFDGSEGAWKLGMWRYGPGITQMTPLDTFMAQFYDPGLLGDLMHSGHLPSDAALDFSHLDRPAVSLLIRPAGIEAGIASPLQQSLRQLQASQSAGSGVPVETRTVDVEIEIDEPATPGAMVRGLRLFRNGSRVQAWQDGIGLDASGHAVVSTKVAVVAGSNRLVAYGFSETDIKGPDATLIVTGSSGLSRKGVAYILSVGINSYSNPQFNLKFAVADAREFSTEISSAAGNWKDFSTVRTISLLDADATRSNILTALGRLAGDGELPKGSPESLRALTKMEPEDVLFIYFAGHGLGDGMHFYLVPQDMGYGGRRAALDDAAAATIRAHSLSDADLESAFDRIDDRQIVLILDACNSGQALEAAEKRMGPLNSSGLAHLAYEKGIYILAAAQPYQSALELAQYGHGLLSYALLDLGLKAAAAANQQGKISIADWLEYAAREVPTLQASVSQRTSRARGFKLKALPSSQSPIVFRRRESDPAPLYLDRAENRN